MAIFAQGASGDQNPLLVAPMQKLAGLRTRMEGRGDERYGALSPWEISARRLNGNADATAQYKIPLKPEEMAAYKAAIDTDDRMVTRHGHPHRRIRAGRDEEPHAAGLGQRRHCGRRAADHLPRPRPDR